MSESRQAKEPATNPRFLSVAEVATIMGVSIHTIYGMISERRLPFRYHKFGRRVLVDRREFERWAAEAGIARDERFIRERFAS